jgi:hypothetical protein
VRLNWFVIVCLSVRRPVEDIGSSRCDDPCVICATSRQPLAHATTNTILLEFTSTEPLRQSSVP